ncbi:MAG: tagaturonate epimerase family protein [candidate division KSB1 bacterium]|nr:tagaturonate epimerase family protein [candidate division KSB1 bacterium]MDZ7273545.1 tagaturonate epimerase family protein [candidate division KSB1 bacterium]MDZ7286864.1 tagaturonate epimerase family protein [candidate division KSB1 bacterium]MDZ7299783.1 tagaturonate epimerase family protein [candidate division KSB1 bacterium]MDZ7307666.1 tagaturonate epimerase family protein [candidate division KSB1 bacterium]
MAMSLMPIIEKLKMTPASGNQPFLVELSKNESLRIYPKSIHQLDHSYFFIARRGVKKYLFLSPANDSHAMPARFEGETLEANPPLKCCPLNRQNAAVLRELFDFTRPVLLGVENSFGLGDRLGLANPAHLRAIAGTPFRAILAQQSIRELERTERTPDEVMDAATWAVFQEGYKKGFGADADHLKTTEHIDRMMQAGFTFFTFDPSAYVVNEAAKLPDSELSDRLKALPWEVLADTPEGMRSRYEGKSFRITDDFEIHTTAAEVLCSLVKYGAVIAHAVTLYRHLESKYRGRAYEVELSVDETDSPTTPFEHFLVANELKRLGVKLVSLAPRFVGDFEKGIDFKGDLALFEKEYVKHVKIAEALGPYKISIHSGSDKFSVYNVIGSLKLGHVHVKTAGTSYLEALRTIAEKEPALFSEILDFARGRYETDKASYHVSAKLERVPPSQNCTLERFLRLFEDNDARQVLHVTFGSVLTCKDSAGKPVFKDRILRALEQHEEAHYENLCRHYRRHIEPFLQ